MLSYLGLAKPFSLPEPRPIADKRRRRAFYPCVLSLEDRIVLNTDTFINPAGGAWNAATNWSLNRAPINGDDVVIPALTGNATVKGNLFGNITINSLTLDATLELSFTLSVTGSVSGSGTIALAGGTLSNATVSKGITVTQISGNSNDTLNNVTINGQLVAIGDVSFNLDVLTITNGLVLNGTMTIGNSSLNGSLLFNGSQSLNGSGTVVFNGTDYGSSINVANQKISDTSSPTLTIGPDITVVSGNGVLRALVYGNQNQGMIVNQGTIESNAIGDPLEIEADFTQTSTGKIEVKIGSGPGSNPSPRIKMSGKTTLSGTLEANYINGFTPVAGQSFWIVGGGPVTGTFTNVVGGSARYDAQDVYLTISKQVTPVIAIASAPNPSTFGQAVTFTATVSPAATGLPTPTGTVIFMDGSTVLNPGGATLISGNATFTTSTLAVGTHSITAVYGGDSNFSGGTSSPITQTVSQYPPDLQMVSVSLSSDGQSVNASYLLTGSNLPLPGRIDFYWATGPTFADRLGSAFQVLTNTTVGSHVASISIFNLGQQPPVATYILAVADSPNADPNHDIASTPAPVDVTLDSAKVVGNQVQFTYTPISNPGLFTIGLYESADPVFDASQDTLVTSQVENPPTNSSTQDSFKPGFLPDPAKPYLLVVVNPQIFVENTTPGAPVHLLPAYLVSQAQLLTIMPALQQHPQDALRYLAPLNEAMEEFYINTPKREAAFLAQVAYESGELDKWTETFPSAANLKKGYHLRGNRRPPLPNTLPDAAAWFEYWYGVNRKYPQPAKDLGNTHPGDGATYYGRGPLQITGRTIYANAGSYLDLNLLAQPNLASDYINTPGVGFRTSAYWWTIFKGSIRLPRRGGKTLTQWADSVNPQNASSVKLVNTMISRIVTGASKDNGSFSDRQAYYEDALNTLQA